MWLASRQGALGGVVSTRRGAWYSCWGCRPWSLRLRRRRSNRPTAQADTRSAVFSSDGSSCSAPVWACFRHILLAGHSIRSVPLQFSCVLRSFCLPNFCSFLSIFAQFSVFFAVFFSFFHLFRLNSR